MVYDASEPPDIPEESLTCELCGQKFETVESLNEHRMSEVKDKKLSTKVLTDLNCVYLVFFLSLHY
jgi:hypothetical protein